MHVRWRQIIFTIIIASVASCTFTKVYRLDDQSYTVVSKETWLHTKEIDDLQVRIRAYNKSKGNFRILMHVANNRNDTIYIDTSGAEIWHSSGNFSPYLRINGADRTPNGNVMIAAGATGEMLYYAFTKTSDSLVWEDTIYSYLGVIRSSSGFQIDLDTLRFIMVEE